MASGHMRHKLAAVRVKALKAQGVPSDARHLVEARVSPTDVDQVRHGQQSLLRLTALNQRTTPTMSGKVVDIAADLSRDHTGSFYAARIELSD